MNTAAAVILLAAAVAGDAQVQVQAPAPWHAVVTSPRPSFPTVTIDLGYRGPYVPTETSPITIHATAGSLPFDGYLGYHYRVGDRQTADTPVIARAVLRPHESWTFSTFTRLRHFGDIRGVSPENLLFAPRELVVEWRSASMRVATQQSAGIPPWTLWRERLKPLRISTAAIAGSTLGQDAHVEQPNALSDRAPWYGGFSELVTPVDVWIDLPLRVRQAILGSSIPVVFYGVPRANQRLDALDRALLPVTFDPRPGAYQAPWPYGNSAAVATPVSWTGKSETYAIGNGPLPYMVRSNAATWVADEAGIAHALPAVRTTPSEAFTASLHGRMSTSQGMSAALPRPGQIARFHPAALLVLFGTIAALVGWVLFRRRPRTIIAAVLAIMAFSIVAARYRIRPRSGVYDALMQRSVAPGIVGTVQGKRIYGASPIPAEQSDPERMRTSITSTEAEEDAELRTSDNGVAMGTMRRRSDWDALTRWWKRSELGDAAAVQIRERNRRTLVFDYQAPFAVTEVDAEWLCGSRYCFGEANVPPSASGRVTITHGHTVWEEDEPFLWSAPLPVDWNRPSTARITLVQREPRSMRVFQWIEPAAQPSSGSFLLTDRGSDSFTFALPAGIAASATAFVDVPGSSGSTPVSLSWAGGSTTLAPAGRKGLAFRSLSYAVPPSILHDAVGKGGIVKVATPPDAHITVASIEVWEKKP